MNYTISLLWSCQTFNVTYNGVSVRLIILRSASNLPQWSHGFLHRVWHLHYEEGNSTVPNGYRQRHWLIDHLLYLLFQYGYSRIGWERDYVKSKILWPRREILQITANREGLALGFQFSRLPVHKCLAWDLCLMAWFRPGCQKLDWVIQACFSYYKIESREIMPRWKRAWQVRHNAIRFANSLSPPSTTSIMWCMSIAKIFLQVCTAQRYLASVRTSITTFLGTFFRTKPPLVRVPLQLCRNLCQSCRLKARAGASAC